jgi:hypothetical protein
MSGFPIQTDATQLFYHDFFLLGPEGATGTVSANAPVKLQLAPGSYAFQFGSGMIADFNFTVTAGGGVDFDANCDQVLGGRATSLLTIRGLEVTLDALQLTGTDSALRETGVLLANTQLGTESNLPDPEDWMAIRTIRLLPAKGFGVIVGSALVASFTFDLTRDGTFDYIPTLDSSQGGFLSGRGTSKLTFLGYPITVDATAISDLLIIPVRNFPPSHTGKADVVLLPLHGYPIQLASGVSNLSFNVELNGNVSFDPSLNNALKVQIEAGRTVLQVRSQVTSLEQPTVDELVAVMAGTLAGKWLTASSAPPNITTAMLATSAASPKLKASLAPSDIIAINQFLTGPTANAIIDASVGIAVGIKQFLQSNPSRGLSSGSKGGSLPASILATTVSSEPAAARLATEAAAAAPAIYTTLTRNRG